MEYLSEDIDIRLGLRVRGLRTAKGLSLDECAGASGVSRAMISLVERGKSSPTARVLDRLASALGVSLSALFDTVQAPGREPVARRDNQKIWRDPETGYLRRNLSPAGTITTVEMVEVILPANANVAYDERPEISTLDQQVWVLSGEVEVTVGREVYRLLLGDCLAMRLDQPTAFRNHGADAARYVVATAPSKR